MFPSRDIIRSKSFMTIPFQYYAHILGFYPLQDQTYKLQDHQMHYLSRVPEWERTGVHKL